MAVHRLSLLSRFPKEASGGNVGLETGVEREKYPDRRSGHRTEETADPERAPSADPSSISRGQRAFAALDL